MVLDFSEFRNNGRIVLQRNLNGIIFCHGVYDGVRTHKLPHFQLFANTIASPQPNIVARIYRNNTSIGTFLCDNSRRRREIVNYLLRIIYPHLGGLCSIRNHPQVKELRLVRCHQSIIFAIFEFSNSRIWDKHVAVWRHGPRHQFDTLGIGGPAAPFVTRLLGRDIGTIGAYPFTCRNNNKVTFAIRPVNDLVAIDAIDYLMRKDTVVTESRFGNIDTLDSGSPHEPHSLI